MRGSSLGEEKTVMQSSAVECDASHSSSVEPATVDIKLVVEQKAIRERAEAYIVANSRGPSISL